MFGTRALRHGIRHLARYFILSLGPLCVNPVTATGCKDFRAEKCPHRPAKQCIFWSYNKSIFYIVRFDGYPFMPMRKGKQTDLNISNSHFYWPFSSDSMSVKELNCCRAHRLSFGFLTLLLANTLYCCRACFLYRCEMKILNCLLGEGYGRQFLFIIVFCQFVAWNKGFVPTLKIVKLLCCPY